MGAGIARRVSAACGLLLWAISVYGAPIFHLAHHRDDHVHLASGAVLYTGHDGRYDDPAYWDDNAPYWDDEDAEPDPAHPAIERPHGQHPVPMPRGDHGSNSAAHFTAALTASLPVPSIASQRLLAELEQVRLEARPPHRLTLRAHGARAPPPA